MILWDSKILFTSILNKSTKMMFRFKNDYKNVSNVSQSMSGVRVFKSVEN